MRAAFNRKVFKPTVAAIKKKYYELFRGKGPSSDDEAFAESEAAFLAREGSSAMA